MRTNWVFMVLIVGHCQVKKSKYYILIKIKSISMYMIVWSTFTIQRIIYIFFQLFLDIPWAYTGRTHFWIYFVPPILQSLAFFSITVCTLPKWCFLLFSHLLFSTACKITSRPSGICIPCLSSSKNPDLYYWDIDKISQCCWSFRCANMVRK